MNVQLLFGGLGYKPGACAREFAQLINPVRLVLVAIGGLVQQGLGDTGQIQQVGAGPSDDN